MLSFNAVHKKFLNRIIYLFIFFIEALLFKVHSIPPILLQAFLSVCLLDSIFHLTVVFFVFPYIEQIITASVKNKGTKPDFDENHRIVYFYLIMNQKHVFSS